MLAIKSEKPVRKGALHKSLWQWSWRCRNPITAFGKRGQPPYRTKTHKNCGGAGSERFLSVWRESRQHHPPQ